MGKAKNHTDVEESADIHDAENVALIATAVLHLEHIHRDFMIEDVRGRGLDRPGPEARFGK